MGCVRRILRRLPGAVIAALLAATPAVADPVLKATRTPQGGGLVRHDVSVDFGDGLGRSGFVQVTFSGNFDGSSAFELASWPDIQAVQTSPSSYSLQGGTGGGSQVDVVPLAQLVVAEGQVITYDGVISRNGQNFVIAPEPGAQAAALAAVLALAGLRARARWWSP